jgi:hypothetical protein
VLDDNLNIEDERRKKALDLIMKWMQELERNEKEKADGKELDKDPST